MPVLDITKRRLSELLGKKLTDEQLWELLFQFGMELDSITEDEYKIEITPDRLDMLSPHGLTRALKYYLNIEKPERYEVDKKSGWTIEVADQIRDIRPYIGGFLVKGLEITESDLKEIIYIQEKLHNTICRGREVGAIGIYPSDKITPPIRYVVHSPNIIKFVPLGAIEEMTAQEIIERHPTGQEYAHLLKGKAKYPVLIDSENRILSMPPIINSEKLGRITEETKEFFVEVTGTRKVIVMNVVNMLACMFKDMGGEIFSININYRNGKVITPSFNYESISVKPEIVSKILGVKINKRLMSSLLTKMGYITKGSRILIPPYRTDILHPIDIVDDIARAYTFDKLESRVTPVFTIGKIFEDNILIDRMREIMIGLGFLETFTLGLTSKCYQFDMTEFKPTEEEYVSITKAKATEVDMLRYWLLPELLRSLSINRERQYPLKLFEISDVVRRDTSRKRDNVFANYKVFSFLMSDESITFTDAKRVLTKMMKLLGHKVKIVGRDHPTFIPGRCAEVIVEDKNLGFIGEIHPRILERFDIQMPVSACEIDLGQLLCDH